MAKKVKVKVKAAKSKSVVDQGLAYSASATPVAPNPQLATAATDSLGNVGSTIAANVGSLSQQIDKDEQFKMVESMRSKAKKKKPLPAKRAEAQMQVDPPGTFRNVDNQLVIGDMKKFRKAQVKSKK